MHPFDADEVAQTQVAGALVVLCPECGYANTHVVAQGWSLTDLNQWFGCHDGDGTGDGKSDGEGDDKGDDNHGGAIAMQNRDLWWQRRSRSHPYGGNSDGGKGDGKGDGTGDKGKGDGKSKDKSWADGWARRTNWQDRTWVYDGWGWYYNPSWSSAGWSWSPAGWSWHDHDEEETPKDDDEESGPHVVTSDGEKGEEEEEAGDGDGRSSDDDEIFGQPLLEYGENWKSIATLACEAMDTTVGSARRAIDVMLGPGIVATVEVKRSKAPPPTAPSPPMAEDAPPPALEIDKGDDDAELLA